MISFVYFSEKTLAVKENNTVKPRHFSSGNKKPFTSDSTFPDRILFLLHPRMEKRSRCLKKL